MVSNLAPRCVFQAQPHVQKIFLHNPLREKVWLVAYASNFRDPTIEIFIAECPLHLGVYMRGLHHCPQMVKLMVLWFDAPKREAISTRSTGQCSVAEQRHAASTSKP